MTQTETTILLDIYERLGSIEAQLTSTAKQRDEMKEANDQLERRVDSLEKFEERVGAYIWVGGAIVSGALFLLWEGLAYLLPWLKTILGRATE